ncbi:response regulator transcription factor [Streptomyces sp. NBC_00878]|uniref:response regulator transcription factor n=1 Tax=Streptomyces sp. NBC_00878 TaxID=2975854 RepID=UPI00225379C6|nr:response regulator transcription factor [Streptomyces sp. NBC_00878]MCX4911219.1 response regulator transcription factor [Streptomyces sp. NBC_00878]
MCAHVLVAEDDEKQAALIRGYLEHDGHTVTVVYDGQSAMDQALREPPDLLVLDWMLPGVDGLEVCRRVRDEGGLPVLMLTARSTEDDLLRGLDLGADDYMTKPYSPRELMARVRTLLRRTQPSVPDDPRVLRAGPLLVDPDRHEVACRDRPVPCTPGEFRILEAMAAAPGRVFSRRELLECTQGYDRASTERAIDVHIVNLRRKIETDPRAPEILLTVFGVGYKLTGGRRGT